MGLIVENSIRFNHIASDVLELADILNSSLGDGSAVVSMEEGNDEDTTALLFLDIPSFMSFDSAEKKLYESAVRESDAINFYCLSADTIRLTFAVKDYWMPENDAYETNVIELLKK